MSRKLTLKLSNLYLDLQNPRYEEQRSQNEALNTIASEQKEKLLVLLRDIIAHGLNPSDIPIVMPDKHKVNGYIVLEGNRRIAALKLLKKPSILTNNSMSQKYSKLHDKYKDNIAKNIECLIVENREEADLWIERKHEGEMNGAGTVRWDNVQKGRFLANKTGKDTKVLQLIDFMKIASEDDIQFFEQLQNMSATNLERLISTPDVCTELGLSYSHGEFSSWYKWNEVLKGLKAIVTRLSNPDFSVKAIYHREDRLKFINSIPREELPDKKNKSREPWKLKDFKADQRNQGKANSQTEDSADYGANGYTDMVSVQRPTSRRMFIPEDLLITIPNERINRIYRELKLLSHVTLPNACAVMLRVFLELSVDKYMETFNLLKNDALTGARDKRDLKQKTNAVILHMNQTKRADEAITKGIKTEVNKDYSPFSIDTMNAYVHNGDFNPIPENLMLTWDNIQPFVVALWKAINDNRK